jgi:rhodanese-related sulfurtransferase
MLRLKADSLDPNKQYITYCDTGRRSSAAAFLLSERGLKAYCLKGGLMAHGGGAG